jgi:hypothetical protein
MLAAITLVVVYQFAPEGFRTAIAPWKPILILETFLIEIFGVSWFEKGRELAAPELDAEQLKTTILAPS